MCLMIIKIINNLLYLIYQKTYSTIINYLQIYWIKYTLQPWDLRLIESYKSSKKALIIAKQNMFLSIGNVTTYIKE